MGKRNTFSGIVFEKENVEAFQEISRNNTAFFSFCGLNGSLKNVKFSHLIFGIFIEVGKIESKKQKEDIMTNIIKKENAQPATFGSVVDRLFQNNLHRFFDDDFFGFNGVQSLNNVPVNIRETDKAYELELIAPGLRKEDFHLNLSGDVLTVSFEHAEEKQDEGKNQSWLRREYKKAAFTRSFNLDDTVDASKAAAHYQDGVLRLSLPKKESAQKLSRTIAVQ